jgi:hypothetical protein
MNPVDVPGQASDPLARQHYQHSDDEIIGDNYAAEI